MAFAASDLSDSTRLRPAIAIGNTKAQFMKWSAASGDTSGTVTADGLAEVQFIIMSGGLSLTADPTYATNVVTLAFADPLATVKGSLVVFGI